MGPLNRAELPDAVEIFRRAFADEHASRFRGGARPAFADVWRFIQATEPRGFLGAREDSRLVGYAIFVRSLKALQRRAFFSGEALRWAMNALAGRYDLRRDALWTILRNKMLFVANGQRYRTRGDAQLLNIAVDPARQGRGTARALVERGLQHLANEGVEEVRLEVRPWNTGARRLYETSGWSEVGRTRDSQGEWLVMVAKPSAASSR